MLNNEIKSGVLESWIREKSFEDLTAEEQALVRHELSEEKYRQMHQLVRELSLSANDLPLPSPEMDQRLEDALAQRQSTSLLRTLLSYPVPAWQAVAAIAFFLMASSFLRPEQPSNPTASNIREVVMHHTDTVFIEKFAEVPPAEVSSGTPSRTSKPAPMVLQENAVRSMPAPVAVRGPEILPAVELAAPAPIGRTAKDESALMELLVEIN